MSSMERGCVPASGVGPSPKITLGGGAVRSALSSRSRSPKALSSPSSFIDELLEDDDSELLEEIDAELLEDVDSELLEDDDAELLEDDDSELLEEVDAALLEWVDGASR